MLNRSNFIRRFVSGIIALPVIGLKNPLKATEPELLVTSQELTNPFSHNEGPDDLWPNDKPMPCDTLPEELKHPKINCRFCRYKHNMMILESDPEWFDNIQVDLDGKWSEVGFL